MTSGAQAAAFPPELAQPLPRRVRSTAWLWGFVALLTVFLVGPCLLFLGVIYSVHHDRSILRAGGVPTSGEITDLKIERSKNSYSYRASYRFQHPSGGADQRFQTGFDFVSEAHYRYLQVGEIVPILYEPNRPGNSGLKFDDSVRTSDDSKSTLLLTLCIVGLFGGIYVLFVAVLIIPYIREKKLLQWGSVASAIVLSEEEISGRYPTMTATYQFTDDHGRSVVGIQKNLPSAKKLDWPGFQAARDAVMKAPIAIYDPKNPTNSMLYRASSAICY
jgi:hypothetical protein